MNIIYIDKKIKKLYKNYTSQFICKVKYINFSKINISEINNIIQNSRRIVFIGEKIWDFSQTLMKFSGNVVANLFTEADSFESPLTNGANVAIIDIYETGILKSIDQINIWLGIVDYAPDGMHDKYVERLRSWGVKYE